MTSPELLVLDLLFLRPYARIAPRQRGREVGALGVPHGRLTPTIPSVLQPSRELH